LRACGFEPCFEEPEREDERAPLEREELFVFCFEPCFAEPDREDERVAFEREELFVFRFESDFDCVLDRDFDPDVDLAPDFD
jgi:hypothetical protein